jgi:predicted phosphodiesterase
MYLKRAGIIGDVHAEDVLLEVVLSFLRHQSLSTLLCTGDVVSGIGSAGRCIDLLEANTVSCVRGNHDRWFTHSPLPYQEKIENATLAEELTLSQRAFLAELKPTQDFVTPQGNLLLCHGLGSDDMAGVYPGDIGFALEGNHRLNALIGAGHYLYVINGHTHRPMVRTIHGLTIINAGTLRRDHQPTFAIADWEECMVTFYQIDLSSHKITLGETVSLKPAPPGANV